MTGGFRRLVAGTDQLAGRAGRPDRHRVLRPEQLVNPAHLVAVRRAVRARHLALAWWAAASLVRRHKTKPQARASKSEAERSGVIGLQRAPSMTTAGESDTGKADSHIRSARCPITRIPAMRLSDYRLILYGCEARIAALGGRGRTFARLPIRLSTP